VDSRLDGIAAALGVDREALIPPGNRMVPGDLVERCRTQIAQAAGIAPEGVRIFLEL
jgi:hypothetical protein